MTHPQLHGVPPQQAKTRNPRILVYGKPGVGKTWALLDLPKAYYIDAEGAGGRPRYKAKLEAAGGAYFGVEHGARDFDKVIEEVQALATVKHDYQYLVIDTLSEMFHNKVIEEAERLRITGQKNDFSQDRKPAYALTKKLLDAIAELTDKMAVIIVTGEEMPQGALEPVSNCWKLLEYRIELALRIDKVGNRHDATVKKSWLKGFKTDEVFDWSKGELEQRFAEEAEIVEQGEPAPQDKVSILDALIVEHRVPITTMNKWLVKAGVGTLDELDEPTVDKLIAHLQKPKKPKE